MAKRHKKKTTRTWAKITDIIIQILVGLITGILLLMIERLLQGS